MERSPRILKIARMGHPILREQCAEVEDPSNPEVKHLIADMHATLEDKGSYIGLAAPQVHVPLRIMLFSIPRERDPNASYSIPLTATVNCRWEAVSEDKESGWEGCFSMPDLLAWVPRYCKIKYTYQTLEGKTVMENAKGFHARVIQHECDHLDGVLFTKHLENSKDLAYRDEAIRYLI
jgi:peptide deformylase